MARLIDADKFLSSMIKRFKCVPLIGRNDYDCESLKQMLVEAPTVDAVEVVHGRWIELPSMAPEYKCSECGYSYEWWEVNEAHYCPNCGAKMDGGTDNG